MTVAQNVSGANTRTIRFAGAPTGTCQQFSYAVNNATGDFYDCLAGTWFLIGPAAGSGTVTSFSSGNLSPLFTTSVATATSTPALSFALSNAAAHTFYGNNTGSTAAPAFYAIGLGDLPSGVGLTASPLSQFASTTSSQLAGVISDETGTAGKLVFDTSPTLVTPTIGVATATSINKMAITAPATSSTLAVADGKTATVSNTLTFVGTDATTQTFPSVSTNVMGLLSVQNSTTDTLSANSGTQNFATTYQIPSNYLVANKLLRLTLSFSMTTSAATIPTIGVNLKMGSTTVFTSAGTASTASRTIPISIEFLIQGTAAAGASVAVHVDPITIQGVDGTTTTPFRLFTTAVAQPVNLATNGALTIQPTVAYSNSTAGNSITLRQMVVEALN